MSGLSAEMAARVKAGLAALGGKPGVVLLRDNTQHVHGKGSSVEVLERGPAPEMLPSNDPPPPFVNCGGAALGHPKGCTGHGECKNMQRKSSGKIVAMCKCEPGWTGLECQMAPPPPECPDGCNDDGGRCLRLDKHGNVTHNAKEGELKCLCFLGWAGADCNTESCPNNCTKAMDRGECTASPDGPSVAATCTCTFPFSGDDCMDTIGCGGTGHDCGNGMCIEGSCLCYKGWGGPLCDRITCPNNCTGAEYGQCDVVASKKHGHRRRKEQCVCQLGHKGADCSVADPCPRSCSGHGKCSSEDPADSSRHCECTKDNKTRIELFTGRYCEKPNTNLLEGGANRCPPPGDCGGEGRGKCVNAQCECEPGWGGHGCTKQAQCINNCTGRGRCVNGACDCFPGFEGSDCARRSQCPNMCNRRGNCLLGKCECKKGFEGEDCGIVSVCPMNKDTNATCSAPHGTCSQGACVCMMGYSGEDCSVDTLSNCPKKCSGHGLCHDAKCFCQPGFQGKSCEEQLVCAARNGAECSGSGVCKFGKCFCLPGRLEPDCRAEKACPRDHAGAVCSGGGVCVNGTCFCAPGRYGEVCQRGDPCPANCTRNGFCHHGKCLCDVGFTGTDCGTPVQCPGAVEAVAESQAEGSEGGGVALLEVGSGRGVVGRRLGLNSGCAGHGRCLRGRCYCGPGWIGDDCGVPLPCPDSCSEHGHCAGPVCVCDPGFQGANCSQSLKCTNDCNGHGVCILGFCACRAGFEGVACEMKQPCPNRCSGHGECAAGSCACDAGFGGVDCAETSAAAAAIKVEAKTTFACPFNCSGHGACSADSGDCLCESGWQGPGCNVPLNCPQNCTGHGMCHFGTCFCDPGYNGTSCALYQGCPGFNDKGQKEACAGHGVCSHGKCFCSPGFEGASCDLQALAATSMMQFKETCPMALGGVCGGHGRCKTDTFQCDCENDWYGAACDQQTKIGRCPNKCSNKGLCVDGRCMCGSGWQGDDCSKMTARSVLAKKVRCACGPHGTCNPDGSCKCFDGFIGKSCDKEECPNRCSADEDGVAPGACVDGKCVCDQGYGGDDCGIKCPNLCSRFGQCMADNARKDASYHCQCSQGHAGPDCSKRAVVERNGVVVSSVIAIAIATFVVGLCCIPLAKDYFEKREMTKYMEIIRGEGSMESHLHKLTSIPVKSPVG